jgi:hypothetical protein
MIQLNQQSKSLPQNLPLASPASVEVQSKSNDTVDKSTNEKSNY